MNYRIVNQICIGLIMMASCKNPIMRSRINMGNADHSAEIAQVGTNLLLPAPENVQIENNATAEQKYLMLRWNLVPGAAGYRVCRAVYPAHTYTSGLPDQAFKRLIELQAQDFHHKDIMDSGMICLLFRCAVMPIASPR